MEAVFGRPEGVVLKRRRSGSCSMLYIPQTLVYVWYIETNINHPNMAYMDIFGDAQESCCFFGWKRNRLSLWFEFQW